MREHPPTIRCALLACFVGVRTMEVIDDVVRMMPEIMRRIATQTEKPLSCAGCKAGVELGSCLTTAG
jgi:hypothetical protein